MHKQVFYWIAFYENGQCLPQYDFETGKENLFLNVEIEKVIKLGWFPFSPDLAQKVGEVAVVSMLPHYIADVQGRKPIILRSPSIDYMGPTGPEMGRKTEYLLGWEDNGKRSLIVIQENGTVEMKEVIANAIR